MDVQPQPAGPFQQRHQPVRQRITIVPGSDRYNNKTMLHIITDLPLRTRMEHHGLHLIRGMELIPGHLVLPLIQEGIHPGVPIARQAAVVQEAEAVQEVVVDHHPVQDLHAVTTKQRTTIA